MRRAIRKHLRDFIAILFLVIVAAGTAGYILSNQRFYLPAWVPGIGTDFYTVEAEFETGQAVVPGQGQSVNIAGVKVGDIGEVELEDGVAVVQLKIQDKYKPIYRDATMLLRPKTGLKDMFVELDPGTQAAGELPEDGRIEPGPDAARREPGRDPGAARRRHARLPHDPRQRGRRGVHGRPDPAVRAVLLRRPARDVQAVRADERLHQEVHRPPVRAARERAARDPQLQPARAGAGGEGRAARRAGRVLERELPGLRRAGGEPPPLAAAPAEHAFDNRADARARSRRSRASSGRASRRCGRSRATSGRRWSTCGPPCAPPLRSSATRSARSPASRAAPCASCVPRPRSSLPRPHASTACSGSSTTSSTRSHTTRPATRRATSSGPRGPTTPPRSCSTRRTPTGRSGEATSWWTARASAAVEALVRGLPQLELLFELLNAPDSDEVCAQQPTPSRTAQNEKKTPKAATAKAASGGFD